MSCSSGSGEEGFCWKKDVVELLLGFLGDGEEEGVFCCRKLGLIVHQKVEESLGIRGTRQGKRIYEPISAHLQPTPKTSSFVFGSLALILVFVNSMVYFFR